MPKSPPAIPLLALLDPRPQLVPITIGLAAGLGLAAAAMLVFRAPLWAGTAIVLAVMLVPGAIKWRADGRRAGRTAMVLSMLVAMQGFHSIEHIVQWVQNHVLHWEARVSTGLLSPANAEWVHFVWNWAVLLTVIYLLRGGVRNGWAWLLVAWSLAHTLEHTYLFIRHLEVLEELRRMGVTGVTAQGLPGIFGRDGWLARSEVTRGTFLCTLPGLATAQRLDVHFWWNNGETTLLLLAANTYLYGRLAKPEAGAAAGLTH